VEADELYSVTPSARRTQRSRTAQGESQDDSQVSMASSQPASQLLQDSSQPQSQPPAAAEESNEEEDEEPAPSVSQPRAKAFQTALGQLIDGPLFANDAADVEPLVAAVNARLKPGEARFEDDEAYAALQVLNDNNRIMLVQNIVYKI